MSDVKVKLWGRDFELPVEKARCKNEKLAHVQGEALQNILDCWDVVEASLGGLKKYCVKNNRDEIGGQIDNIFKYVMPKALYISRCRTGRVCAVLCNYRFDPEHGLALVFKDEELTDIGPGDIVP